MSNLFNLRAGNKLRLKAKINWLGWRINNYYHKNAQKNKNSRKETNIEMSPMPNIKHTLAILTNSLDTMYCQQRKNGESSKQSRNPMSQFSLGSAEYSWTQTPWQREKLLLRIFYHCTAMHCISSTVCLNNLITNKHLQTMNKQNSITKCSYLKLSTEAFCKNCSTSVYTIF